MRPDHPGLAFGSLWVGITEVHGLARVLVGEIRPERALIYQPVDRRDLSHMRGVPADRVCQIRHRDLATYFRYVALCDFCSSNEVTWLYPTEGVLLRPEGIVMHPDGSTTSEKGRLIGSDPGWGACDPCAELVESGDADALARRSAKATIDLHRDALEALGAGGGVEAVWATTVEFQREGFWQCRSGQRVPYDREEP